MDCDNLTTSKPMIANDIHVPPPTFSRLPPDGHEFPPNFSEPIIITSVFKQNADIKLGGDRSRYFFLQFADDCNTMILSKH